MNFNYCSKVHTQPIKGGGMKKKRAGKSTSLFPHFMRKREKNLKQKVSCWGQMSRGKSAFSNEDHFQSRVFPAKETSTYCDEINVKMKQTFLCGSHGLNPLSLVFPPVHWTLVLFFRVYFFWKQNLLVTFSFGFELLFVVPLEITIGDYVQVDDGSPEVWRTQGSQLTSPPS